MLDWIPKGGSRRVGRPLARWEDNIEDFMRTRGGSCRRVAKDRKAWSALEDEYVKIAD